MNKQRLFASLLLAATLPLATSISTVRAADHADSPTVASDQGVDLADVYFFEDPADDTKVVLITTLRGFIVPGEAGNFAIFDSTARFRFQIENTEDAKSDAFIDVSFSEKDSAGPQTATVVFTGQAFDGIKAKEKHTATTTVAGLGPNPPGGVDYFPSPAQKLKDKQGADTDIEFFAGETDDPFFFDIPGFARFRTKVLANDPTAGNELSRGRDTFAGYNLMAIALRLPKALLVNTKEDSATETKFGVSFLAQRGNERVSKGRKIASSAFKTVDRMGFPGINALLMPLELKNAYNGSTTIDDSEGKFAEAITAALEAFGIGDDSLALLASLAIERGDILRLDTEAAPGFPNGRRPEDDVVKSLLSVIAGATLDDSVPANEVPFADRFPYLGYPHQPLAPGVLDDKTRN